MEATVKSLRVDEEFVRGHGDVKRDWFPQFADPCVFNDCEYKVAGFAFGGGKEVVSRDFCRVYVFGLGPYHICGIVQDCLIIDIRLGGLEELVSIVLLVVVLV